MQVLDSRRQGRDMTHQGRAYACIPAGPGHHNVSCHVKAEQQKREGTEPTVRPQKVHKVSTSYHVKIVMDVVGNDRMQHASTCVFCYHDVVGIACPIM